MNAAKDKEETEAGLMEAITYCSRVSVFIYINIYAYIDACK